MQAIQILVIFHKTTIAIKNNNYIRPKIINEIFLIGRECEIAIFVILCQLFYVSLNEFIHSANSHSTHSLCQKAYKIEVIQLNKDCRLKQVKVQNITS